MLGDSWDDPPPADPDDLVAAGWEFSTLLHAAGVDHARLDELLVTWSCERLS